MIYICGETIWLRADGEKSMSKKSRNYGSTQKFWTSIFSIFSVVSFEFYDLSMRFICKMKKIFEAVFNSE